MSKTTTTANNSTGGGGTSGSSTSTTSSLFAKLANKEFNDFAVDEPEIARLCKTYDRFRGSYSPLQRERLNANCDDYLPNVFQSNNGSDGNTSIVDVIEDETFDVSTCVDERVKSFFPNTLDMKPLKFIKKKSASTTSTSNKPLRIGCVLSGGQAPGGHNIICGIYDRAISINSKSRIFGFIDGPHGIFSGNFYILTKSIIDGFRNTGGFDMLGSGRHKIESNEQFENSLKVCNDVLNLDGLIVIGGDDSNTNAALLGEYFKSQNSKCKVIGCPKTIDGDLKVHPFIPVSFGFDTACRTFSELIGNCSIDSLSAQKYYHFIRLMGRSASNIALECTLQTLPNLCFIGEEVQKNKWGLKELTNQLVNMIEKRYVSSQKTYGVVLLPEGLIEFIPEFNVLISELNDLGDKLIGLQPHDIISSKILKSASNHELYEYLPNFIQQQLLLDRDPHGNVQVAKIETEKLLASTVHKELLNRFNNSEEKVNMIFQPQFHAFGYEGRAGLPSLFDSAYCYALGSTATQLIKSNKTGLIASVTGLENDNPKHWSCGGVPVTSLCVIERRKGKDKPVIRKALVELENDKKPLNNSPFYTWKLLRELCQIYDLYTIPGPCQYDTSSSSSNDDRSKIDIPYMLRIELEGSSNMLLSLVNQIVPKKDPNVDNIVLKYDKNNEEVFFNNLLEYCETNFPLVLDEKQYTVKWPNMKESFTLKGGVRPKSPLKLRRYNDGYDINSFFSTCKDEDFFSPDTLSTIVFVEDETTQCIMPEDEPFLKKMFPHTYGRRLVEIKSCTTDNSNEKQQQLSSSSTNAATVVGDGKDNGVGIVFIGRQTPGGHDVVAGLWDMYNGKGCRGNVRVVGFVGGSRGLFSEQILDLTPNKIDEIRHTGGYNLFGRSEAKFCNDDTEAELITSILRKHGISSLLLVGGLRTTTSACHLSEYFERQNAQDREAGVHATPLKVVSVPMSQGGSFHNEFIEQPCGFDSTSKVTACLAGNTEIDGSSARKYYYFLRTMEGGYHDNTSHLTLEVGLQAKPNYIIIGEECTDKKQSLTDIVSDIADMVQRRWDQQKKNFGTVIVPDNLVAVIPEIRVLITELTKCGGNVEQLSAYSRALLKSLPEFVVKELLKKKIDTQQIQTERMLAEMVQEELKRRPSYDGKFSAVCQFLGYQARCTLPSAFDSNYGYALGGAAAVLLDRNRNGYMASVANLRSNESRMVFGVPITAMLEVKTPAHGEHLPVAALYGKPVDLHGKAYQEWKRIRSSVEKDELYENPGPIQFRGDCANLQTKLIGDTNGEEEGKPSYLSELASLRENASMLLNKLRPGVSAKKLRIANSSLSTLRNVLEEL